MLVEHPRVKRIAALFSIAFVLNLAWENAHAFLYSAYQGGAITELVLLRATLADAIMITAIALPFVFFPLIKKYSWLIVVIATSVAVCIEWYALATNRWSYNQYMPIIPGLLVGLTPTVQLGLLGYLSYLIEERMAVLY